MKKTIEKLTAAQIATFPHYVEKWLAIGLNCEPCNFEAAKAAASDAYRVAGLEPPKLWLLMDSPLSCAIAATILKNSAQVGDHVGAQVGDHVGAKVWAHVGAKVWAQVGDQVRDQVWAQVWAQVWNQVWAQVWDQVGDQVGNQRYGAHDSSWLAFYDFFSSQGGLTDETGKLSPLTELAKHCGWWAPYENLCILQHRHCEVHFNENKRLHNDSGMAVKYRDGFGVWSIHGIRVDEQIVMRPETQTVRQIDSEESQDIRSIRIDRFGWTRYLKESDSECVDFRDNEIEGTKEALYATTRGDKRLVATCATGRVFAMGVPSEVKSCEAAQEWLAGGNKVRIVART